MKFHNILHLGLALSITVLASFFPANVSASEGEDGQDQQAGDIVRVDPLLFQQVPGAGASEVLVTEDGMIKVNIYLTVQGGDVIGRQARGEHREKMETLKQEVRDIRRPRIPAQRPLNPAEEQLYMHVWGLPVSDQDQARLRILLEEIDAESLLVSKKITARLGERFSSSQEEFVAFIELLGGRVNKCLTSMNVILADLPPESIHALADHPLVLHLDADSPGGPELDNQVISTGANFYHDDVPSVDGGPWDVAIIDWGCYPSNPALSSHNFFINNNPGHNHGTAVTGIYASTDADIRGLAYGLQTIFIDYAGEEESVAMAAIDWVLTHPSENAEVINYSWGNGDADDYDYHGIDIFMDGVADTYDIIISKSAGNNGWSNDLPTMTHPAPAYNILVTTSMNDSDTVGHDDDFIDTISSVGPTLNGRRKPDLVAPGIRTHTTWGSGFSEDFDGTSAAAPKTGAGALLLYSFGSTEGMAIRAILINSAESWTCNNTPQTGDDEQIDDSHWDKWFGWGNLELASSWYNANNYVVDNVTAAGSADDYDLFRAYFFEGEKATLVYNRRVGYSGPSVPGTIHPLTDIDLELYDEETGAMDDEDDGANDNVRQVWTPDRGWKVLKVRADSGISGASSEDYALAIEDSWTKMNGPDLSTATLDCPDSVSCGDQFTVSLEILNSGDLYGHTVYGSLSIDTDLILVSGDVAQFFDSVAPGGTVTAEWILEVPHDTNGWPELDFDYGAYCYGITHHQSFITDVEVYERPANNSCSTGTPIPPGFGVYNYSDDSTHACPSYDVAGGCTGRSSPGRDVVYLMYLDSPARICATMIPQASMDASLYLVTDCSDVAGTCLVGSDVAGYGAVESFCAEVNPSSGTYYYIITDCYDEQSGTGGGVFNLEIILEELDYDIVVPGDYNTIQEAISGAPEGAVITVQPGSYAENINFQGNGVTVVSAEGPSTTTIDGGGTGSVVTFNSDEGADSVLEGFTITGGLDVDGGGILCTGAAPTITDNIITGNAAEGSGGGIYCNEGAAPLISHNIISLNSTVTYHGGGIGVVGSSPTIAYNTITGNLTYQRGGGIFCGWDSAPLIAENVIQGNTALLGGGINCWYSQPPNYIPQINNNVITENLATDDGGGVHCHEASPTITNNLVTRNVSTDKGGGIYCRANTEAILVNNTFTGNSAGYPYGGGLHSWDSAVTVTNCIFWGDSPDEIHLFDGTAPVVTYSDIQGGYGGTGNIDENPLFVGGPQAGYLSQISSGQSLDSPCLDRGSDLSSSICLEGASATYCLNATTTCLNGANADNGQVDMGYHHDQGMLGVYVWNATGGNSGDTIRLTLLSLGYEDETHSGSTLPANLDRYWGIFACLGVDPNNHVLEYAEGEILADYLDAGGQLYMEGADTWGYDAQTVVHPYFNTVGDADGVEDCGPIHGEGGTFTQGMSFSYSGENVYMDRISPAPGAFTVLRNGDPVYDNCVAYSGDDYRTIGCAFDFGGLDDGSYPSTKLGLMRTYLDFFSYGFTPVVTVQAGLTCIPGSGTLPFSSQFQANMTNLFDGQARRIKFTLDVTLAGGQHYSPWRQGWQNIQASQMHSVQWWQNIPALGSLLGSNLFQMTTIDVTPPPYNLPPYPPAGDTDTARCTVVGIAP